MLNEVVLIHIPPTDHEGEGRALVRSYGGKGASSLTNDWCDWEATTRWAARFCDPVATSVSLRLLHEMGAKTQQSDYTKSEPVRNLKANEIPTRATFPTKLKSGLTSSLPINGKSDATLSMIWYRGTARFSFNGARPGPDTIAQWERLSGYLLAVAQKKVTYVDGEPECDEENPILDAIQLLERSERAEVHKDMMSRLKKEVEEGNELSTFSFGPETGYEAWNLSSSFRLSFPGLGSKNLSEMVPRTVWPVVKEWLSNTHPADFPSFFGKIRVRWEGIGKKNFSLSALLVTELQFEGYPVFCLNNKFYKLSWNKLEEIDTWFLQESRTLLNADFKVHGEALCDLIPQHDCTNTEPEWLWSTPEPGLRTVISDRSHPSPSSAQDKRTNPERGDLLLWAREYKKFKFGSKMYTHFEVAAKTSLAVSAVAEVCRQTVASAAMSTGSICYPTSKNHFAYLTTDLLKIEDCKDDFEKKRRHVHNEQAERLRDAGITLKEWQNRCANPLFVILFLVEKKGGLSSLLSATSCLTYSMLERSFDPKEAKDAIRVLKERRFLSEEGFIDRSTCANINEKTRKALGISRAIRKYIQACAKKGQSLAARIIIYTMAQVLQSSGFQVVIMEKAPTVPKTRKNAKRKRSDKDESEKEEEDDGADVEEADEGEA
ncbi:hypothetical protein HKX48_008953 [Thoreauomyces humboldtii]|nr:hypothetical protein HKX48_008953 [Thoreauomyces humboldtii]